MNEPYVKKKRIEAFVCTECGRDIPADPNVFDDVFTDEEIQQLEYMYCPDCCGPFMIPVEGPTFGGGFIVATREHISPYFPKMFMMAKEENEERTNERP